MRFLFVANFLGDENAGASGHIIHLAKAINKKGDMAHTFFRNDLIGKIEYSAFFHILIFLLFPLIAAFKIFQLDFKHNYNFIIISSGDGFLYALFAKIILHKKRPLIIMRSHGYEHLCKKEIEIEKRFYKWSYFTRKERLFFFGFRLLQVKIFSYFCDGIFTLNKSEKRYLEKSYPNKKIYAIPIGIDPIFMTHDIEMSRDRDILFVGGWTRLKGRIYLVDVINRLSKIKPDITVSIIGTRVDDKYILGEFSGALRDKIRVVKFLPRDMLKKEYLTHRIFLFPSLFEGYGNAVLEAMASGMVVIISKGLGASEVITDGYNGFLVEKRDVDGFVKTVERVLGDDALLKEIGKNAQESVSHMTWDNIAEAFIKDCEELQHTE